MPLFRALAKNMAPMTSADESPTNRLTLFPIYLSLFVVSTLCLRCRRTDLILPNPKRDYLKKSFKYSGAKLWNSLSTEAKLATSDNAGIYIYMNVWLSLMD